MGQEMKRRDISEEAPMIRSATILALLGMVAMCGCDELTGIGAKSILNADDHMVAKCEFVGDFQEGTKNAVRQEAAKHEVTHIVWSPAGRGAWGKGYKCPKPEARVATTNVPAPDAGQQGD